MRERMADGKLPTARRWFAHTYTHAETERTDSIYLRDLLLALGSGLWALGFEPVRVCVVCVVCVLYVNMCFYLYMYICIHKRTLYIYPYVYIYIYIYYKSRVLTASAVEKVAPLHWKVPLEKTPPLETYAFWP